MTEIEIYIFCGYRYALQNQNTTSQLPTNPCTDIIPRGVIYRMISSMDCTVRCLARYNMVGSSVVCACCGCRFSSGWVHWVGAIGAFAAGCCSLDYLIVRASIPAFMPKCCGAGSHRLRLLYLSVPCGFGIRILISVSEVLHHMGE